MLKIVSLLFLTALYAENKPTRIVSLGPAYTQTLIDIGLEDKIVCSAGPLDTIHSKNKIKYVGPYHKPNIELIISCKPDLIIASFAGTPKETYEKLKNSGYNIILDRAKNLESVKDFILKIAKIFELSDPNIIKEFNKVCEKQVKKNGVLILGLEPLILAGKDSFVSDVMKCSGIKNNIKGLYPRISIEKILNVKADFVFLAIKSPENLRDYNLLKDFFKEKLIIVDPDKILMPSTRIIDGVKYLKQTIGVNIKTNS